MKLGRPPRGQEKGPNLRKFTIVLDEEVNLAINDLARAIDPDVRRGRRSIAVRKAILDSRARLK